MNTIFQIIQTEPIHGVVALLLGLLLVLTVMKKLVTIALVVVAAMVGYGVFLNHVGSTSDTAKLGAESEVLGDQLVGEAEHLREALKQRVRQDLETATPPNKASEKSRADIERGLDETLRPGHQSPHPVLRRDHRSPHPVIPPRGAREGTQ